MLASGRGLQVEGLITKLLVHAERADRLAEPFEAADELPPATLTQRPAPRRAPCKLIALTATAPNLAEVRARSRPLPHLAAL